MKLLDKFNLKTNNIALYQEALTHSSYANEEEVESYQRLEFLGDAVLELIISEYLYFIYDGDEGILTKKRAVYVCENALYIFGLKLGIDSYIKLGKGENETGGRESKTIIADVVESFFGAIFLDKGYDYTKQFVFKYIVPIIEDETNDFYEDYKSKFQELVQTDKKRLKYVVIKEDGVAHQKQFTVAVKLDGVVYGIGKAQSKKEAEQNAAKSALEKCAN